MALRAVFFDMDDTLVETSASQYARAEIVAAYLRRYHPELSHEALRRGMLEHGEYPWARGAEPVLRELGLLESPAATGAIELWFFRGCERLLAPRPEMQALIRDLAAAYTLGVVTNGLERRQGHKFRQLGIGEAIDVFVTSERAGARKPDPRSFVLALREAGVDASEAAFVGDSFETDVIPSLALGMRAIWFNPTREPPPEYPRGAYTEIQALDELRRLL